LSVSGPVTTPPSNGSTGSARSRQSSLSFSWPSFVLGALLAAIGLGAALLFARLPDPPPIVLHLPPTATPVELPATPPEPSPIAVFVSGAVQQPGLYVLPPGARVADAIAAAGGLAPAANPAAVNQATLLNDGTQVHVPTLEERSEPPAAISGAADPTGAGMQPGGRINVNSASAAELETLPGIGPARAVAIIANRPYANVDDLTRVSGIGPATVEKLRDLVTVE
jgi:competence protein ComEA